MHAPKNGLQKTLQIIGTYLNKSIFESSENLRFCAMYKKCALYCIYYIFLWKWEEFLDRLMFLSGGSQRLKDSLSFLGRQWTALNSWLLPVNLLADDSFSCTNMALVSKGQTVDLISISQVASSFLKEKFGLQAFWMSCSGCASVLWEETLHCNKPLVSSQVIHPSDLHCTTEKHPEDGGKLLHQGTPYHCWAVSPVLLGRKRGEEEQKQSWVVVIILLRLPREEELELLEMRGVEMEMRDVERRGVEDGLGHLERGWG